MLRQRVSIIIHNPDIEISWYIEHIHVRLKVCYCRQVLPSCWSCFYKVWPQI